MTFMLTQDEQDDDIVRGIEAREKEIANYQLNIDNFNDMLAALSHLPAEWPDNLLEYRGMKPVDVAATAPEADYETISDLQARDHLRVLLRSSQAEKRKADRAYAAIQNRITLERLSAARARVGVSESVDLLKLKDELTLDPLARGYSAMTDIEIRQSLNTKDRSRVNPIVSAELLAWSTGASDGDRPRRIKLQEAADSHTNEQVKAAAQSALDMARVRDATSLDLNLSDRVDMLDALVAGGVLSAADHASLYVLATEAISRAEELELGLVRESDIMAARG